MLHALTSYPDIVNLLHSSMETTMPPGISAKYAAVQADADTSARMLTSSLVKRNPRSSITPDPKRTLQQDGTTASCARSKQEAPDATIEAAADSPTSEV